MAVIFLYSAKPWLAESVYQTRPSVVINVLRNILAFWFLTSSNIKIQQRTCMMSRKEYISVLGFFFFFFFKLENKRHKTNGFNNQNLGPRTIYGNIIVEISLTSSNIKIQQRTCMMSRNTWHCKTCLF